MLLIADENVHGKVVASLRTAGYYLPWIKEFAVGALDPDILARPDVLASVFITNDSDFGELIFNKGFRPPQAILYTRTLHRDWRLTSDLLLRELEQGVTLGHMTTITSRSIRRTPFPIGAIDD